MEINTQEELFYKSIMYRKWIRLLKEKYREKNRMERKAVK